MCIRDRIRDICKDETFLAQKAEPATPDDLSIAADLLETLEHHKAGCVGMAANMIGVNKRIIAFDNEGTYMVMFNPEIIKQSGPYEAEEGCLSLTGTRPAKRWKDVYKRQGDTQLHLSIYLIDLFGHGQRSGIQIQVGPLEGQQFSSAKASR